MPGVPKEETLELLNVFLSFITDKPVNFDQWFGWYKQYFITAFYPNVCKEINLLMPEDGIKPLFVVSKPGAYLLLSL